MCELMFFQNIVCACLRKKRRKKKLGNFLMKNKMKVHGEHLLYMLIALEMLMTHVPMVSIRCTRCRHKVNKLLKNRFASWWK